MNSDAEPNEPKVTRTVLLASAIGVALLALFFLVLPLVDAYAPLALVLSPLCSLAITIASTAFVARRSWIALLVTGLVLLAIAVPAGAVGAKFEGGFAVRTLVDSVASPDGRLVLIHTDTDSGALGVGWQVYVRRTIVPGLVDLVYNIDTGLDYPDGVSWADGSNVWAGGHRYPVPWQMLWP